MGKERGFGLDAIAAWNKPAKRNIGNVIGFRVGSSGRRLRFRVEGNTGLDEKEWEGRERKRNSRRKIHRQWEHHRALCHHRAYTRAQGKDSAIASWGDKITLSHRRSFFTLPPRRRRRRRWVVVTAPSPRSVNFSLNYPFKFYRSTPLLFPNKQNKEPDTDKTRTCAASVTLICLLFDFGIYFMVWGNIAREMGRILAHWNLESVSGGSPIFHEYK